MRHTPRLLTQGGLLAAIVFAFVAAAPTSASAYETIGVAQFGCRSVAWPSRLLPAPYYINQNGSDDLPLSTLVTIINDSFAEWAAPCCSSFAATYQGTTADDITTSKTVIHFYESAWPASLGDSTITIGAAVPRMTANCEITSGDIAFNGIQFTFIHGDPTPTQPNHADLQSIAVHEIGHFLGLDHVLDAKATMNWYYSNDITERDLSPDDEAGVCFLYYQGCPCGGNTDCSALGELCLSSGRCGVPECSSTMPCPTAQQCVGGLCEAVTIAADAGSSLADDPVVEEDSKCSVGSLRASTRTHALAGSSVLFVLGVVAMRRRSAS